MEHTCEICGGIGVVEKDDKLFECECAELRRIAAAMPSYVRTAIVKENHVKIALSDGTRILDSIDKSLYVTAYWGDMRAIIKLVMVKHRNKFIRIISDRELRDVFVGSTSRIARGEDSKEPVYNSIEDLVKSPNLLMIRLNELGYKNKAAAGILEEALCYRLDRSLPIWLLSNASKPFCSGSHAYSETVWSLIMSLHRLRVDPILPVDGSIDSVENIDHSILVPEQIQQTKVSKKKILPIEQKVRSIEDDSQSSGGLSSFGKGVKPKPGFFRKG